MGAKFWAITRDTETVNMAASVRVGTASFHTGGKIVKIKQPSANTNSFILWENTYIFISCPYSQFLRSSLLHQPCEQFLATENRQLLFEGLVTLNGKMSTSFLWNYSVQPKILFTVKNYVFFSRNYKEFWHLPVRIWWCDVANETKENSQKGKRKKRTSKSFIHPLYFFLCNQ